MILATDHNPDGHGFSLKGVRFLGMRDAIMALWERETRMRVEGAAEVLRPVLTNTLPAFLDNIAEALSPDYARSDATSNNNSASAHGQERARMTSFGPDQVVHEYQILREAIASVAQGRIELNTHDWQVIDRSINRAVREAVREFSSIQEELRRKLAAALSHDMRTPLANISTAMDLVKLSNDPDAMKRYAGKAQSNARRLESMMSELLDALTSNGGEKLQLTPSTFDIGSLVSEVCDEYRFVGGTRFDVRIAPVRGTWCYSSLRRALENLINNAVKYGDRGVIGLYAQETRGRLMLSVHNTGSFIPKENLGDIFDYLTRGEHQAQIGWGLGLPFVKRVAESHGGTVAVDSSLDAGTTFLIDIPVDCQPFL